MTPSRVGSAGKLCDGQTGSGGSQGKETDLPISLSLGVLGINGVTAHLALTLIGEPKAGENGIWSRRLPAPSVPRSARSRKYWVAAPSGSPGAPTKSRLCLEEFGYNAALDYRADDLESGIAKACPEGVNVYFDNTAGPISDIASGIWRAVPASSLRHGVGIELVGVADRAARRAPPVSKARTDAGLYNLRPHGFVRGFRCAAR